MSDTTLQSVELGKRGDAKDSRYKEGSSAAGSGSSTTPSTLALHASNSQFNDFRFEFSRAPKLPPFDVALDTRKRCLHGLAISYALSVILVVCGILGYVFAGRQVDEALAAVHKGDYYKLRDMEFMWYPTVRIGTIGDGPKEILILIFTVFVTGATENLGYIHATSLRWALYEEGRLHHNSNIRFFTSARKSAPNSWYSNILWAFLLTMLYSCAAQSIVSDKSEEFGFNSLAILLGGICLLLLCLLTSWSLLPRYNKQIVSWNSDPLNTTLALRHMTGQFLKSQAGRAPKSRQPSLRSMNPGTTWAVVFLWLVVLGVCIPMIFLVIIRSTELDYSFVSTTETGKSDYFFLVQTLVDDCNNKGGNEGTIDCLGWRATPAANIFFLAAIQILYTLALHCAEQLVNLTRDEASWRRAYPFTFSKHSNNSDQPNMKKKFGTVVGRNSTKAAFTAWNTLFLFILKPVSHWLFGLCVIVSSTHYITFHPMPLAALSGVALILSIFATVLAFQKPKGPQPATYGDLKMLAEMIDEWGSGAGETLYWGDKGESSGDTGAGTVAENAVLRLAGTSPRKDDVKNIRMEGVLYKGFAEERDVGLKKRFTKTWGRLKWRRTNSFGAFRS